MDNRGRHFFGGTDGFFRSMRRSIIAGQSVDRQQQPEEEDQHHRTGCGPYVGSGSTRIVCEGPQTAEISGWRIGEQRDSQQHRTGQDQIARQIGQLGGGLDAKMIDRRLNAGHHDQEDQLRPVTGLDPHERAERADKEVEGADVDRRQHRDEPDQVEPCGQPAPETASQD